MVRGSGFHDPRRRPGEGRPGGRHGLRLLGRGGHDRDGIRLGGLRRVLQRGHPPHRGGHGPGGGPGREGRGLLHPDDVRPDIHMADRIDDGRQRQGTLERRCRRDPGIRRHRGGRRIHLHRLGVRGRHPLLAVPPHVAGPRRGRRRHDSHRPPAGGGVPSSPRRHSSRMSPPSIRWRSAAPGRCR